MVRILPPRDGTGSPSVLALDFQREFVGNRLGADDREADAAVRYVRHRAHDRLRVVRDINPG